MKLPSGWIFILRMKNRATIEVEQIALKDRIDLMPTIDLPQWIPCSERLPEEDEYYLVTNSKWGSPWREIVLWMIDGWQSGNEPIAWMPLPEPYEGEK